MERKRKKETVHPSGNCSHWCCIRCSLICGLAQTQVWWRIVKGKLFRLLLHHSDDCLSASASKRLRNDSRSSSRSTENSASSEVHEGGPSGDVVSNRLKRSRREAIIRPDINVIFSLRLVLCCSSLLNHVIMCTKWANKSFRTNLLPSLWMQVVE